MPSTFLLVLFLGILSLACAKRLYVHQFDPAFEHVDIKPIILFHIYMGKVSYNHLPLLLESMKWNPKVQFTLINIVDSTTDANDLINLRDSMKVHNFVIHVLSVEQWRLRVKEKLNIDVPFTLKWYYKLNDYKPALGLLFSEMTTDFSYWGFGDMDVVWGNFTKFSSWFQAGPKDSPFVISGWWRSTGAANFYVNEQWTREFFMQDPAYVPLLKDQAYHNLDEAGGQCDTENIVDGGAHGISGKIDTWAFEHHISLNKGKHPNDHCFVDPGDCNDWAGPLRWFRGSLQIIHGSPEFPPGRELLFYHRPIKDFDIPEELKPEMFQDMIEYGYTLPGYIPLVSQYMTFPAFHNDSSTLGSLKAYSPYHKIPW